MEPLRKPKLRAISIWLLAACLISSGFAPVFAQGAWDELFKAYQQGSGAFDGLSIADPNTSPSGKISQPDPLSPTPKEVDTGKKELPIPEELKKTGYFTEEEIDILNMIGRYIDENYVDPVERKKLFYNAIKGMVNTLDRYSGFYAPDEVVVDESVDSVGSYHGTGIYCSVNVTLMYLGMPQPLYIKFLSPGSPAEKAGIKPGDQILSFGASSGRSGLEMFKGLRRLRCTPGAIVNITIRRESDNNTQPASVITVPVKGAAIEDPFIRSEMLPQGIGYIQLGVFTRDSADEFKRELDMLYCQGIKGLIVDLRDNPGGELENTCRIASLFLRKGDIITTERRQNKEVKRIDTKEDGPYADLPLAILVNGNSASASELFAGCMQDHGRARIIGSRTVGKGTVQRVEIFADGSAIKITNSRYHLPSGRCIDGLMTPGKRGGIVPDNVVIILSEPMKAALSAELYEKLVMGTYTGQSIQDPALEKALEIIGSQKTVSLRPAGNLQPVWAAAY